MDQKQREFLKQETMAAFNRIGAKVVSSVDFAHDFIVAAQQELTAEEMQTYAISREQVRVEGDLAKNIRQETPDGSVGIYMGGGSRYAHTANLKHVLLAAIETSEVPYDLQHKVNQIFFNALQQCSDQSKKLKLGMLKPLG